MSDQNQVWRDHGAVNRQSASGNDGTSQVDAAAARTSKIPLIVKLGFTAFMAVLVPYYWHEYGVTNFLYYCDVALFLALIGLWTERPIFASAAAVGITVPQVLWQIDFLGQFAGTPATGMTAYMFDPGISLFARGLSFFHFWLPILLIYTVWKLGYDRRALLSWTAIAWLLMLICFFVLPPAGAELDFANQPHNVNYVYGMDDSQPQSWVSAHAWLGLLMIGLTLVVYVPTHLVLTTLFAKEPQPSEPPADDDATPELILATDGR